MHSQYNYRFYVFLKYLINLWSPHKGVVERHKLLFIENLSPLLPMVALVVRVRVGLSEQSLHLILADFNI